MNIIFSSDDNYARHLGVAIYSIMLHHTNSQRIQLFVVDNNISSENKSKLQKIVFESGKADLSFIPFKQWIGRLNLNMPWPISISSYARLFIGDLLPNEIERVLYLDCDIVVNRDLSELWDTDLGDNIIGAIQDQVTDEVKLTVGLTTKDPYFNAGMILIDLKRWRKANIENKSLSFIESHQGQIIHHDQGVLNGLLRSQWLRLPLKYNVMTIHYILPLKKIKTYYKDKAEFYDSEEIDKARKTPAIVHYTPSFTTHPWVQNCRHPLCRLYHEMLNNTLWKGYPLEREKSPWYLLLINWYYRNLY